MKQYVFISYSTENTAIAKRLRDALESGGIKCWMAPTSIPVGSSYSTEIFDAISDCDVFVLVLSKQAMESVWVPKELDLAINNKCSILPFKIDEAGLSPSFGFYLCNIQMIDAAGGDIDSLNKVVESIYEKLHINDSAAAETAACGSTSHEVKQRFQSPSARVIRFEQAVDRIREELAGHDVVCIKGLAGSGKTELAGMVIKQLLDEGKIHRVSYNQFCGTIRETVARIPFEGISDEEIINKYYKEDADEDIESILFRIKKQLLMDIRSDDLIVIDGLDVYDDNDLDLLRQLPCKVLITTRCQLRDLHTVELDDCVTLRDKANAFISACEDTDITDEETKLVDKMVQAIKGHMLIIRLFARFINTGGYSINEFYDMIKDDKLLKSLQDEVEYNHQYQKIQSHILDVFDLSDLTDDEKNTLYKLTYLPETGVAKRLFRIWNPPGTMSVVDRLVSRGWVVSDKGKISVHPAVTYALGGIRGSVSDYRDFFRGIIDYLAEAKNKDIEGRWKAKDIALYLSETIDEVSAEACEVLLECGAFLDDFAYWKLYGARNLTGSSSLIQVHNKGGDYQEDFKDALQSLRKALKISEKLNADSEDAETAVPKQLAANIRNNLGCTYYNMNDFPAAARYHGDALRMREQFLEPDNDDTITSRRRLGTSCLSMGEYDKALVCYEENLKYESGKGASAALARAFSNCGDVFRMKEDYPQAMSMYEQAIDAFCGNEADMEQDPMGMLQILYRLALVYSSAPEIAVPDKWQRIRLLTDRLSEQIDSDLGSEYIAEITSLASANR